MLIPYEELARIKRLDLPEIIQDKGIPLKQNGNGSYTGLCPFHKDTNPSLNVSQKPNGIWVWHCMGCDAGGTSIDFLMKKESLSFLDAYKELSELDGRYQTQPPHPQAQVPKDTIPDINPQELLNQVVHLYHNSFLQDRRGIQYLIKRGIQDKDVLNHFKVGFVNGSVKELLPSDGNIRQQLQVLGILNEKGNESFYNCVVFPIFDENLQAVGLYGRNIQRQAHLYLKGPHRGVFNWQAAKGYSSLLITEAIIDALTLYTCGFKNVIPSYGTEGFTEGHLKLLRENKTKEVFICYDNDSTGEEASLKLAKLLSTYEVISKRVRLPEGIKDINQYFNYNKEIDFKGTKETFLYLLDNARQIGYSLSGAHKDKGLASADTLDSSFLYDTTEYTVHLIDRDDASSLRVVITAGNSSKRHTDKFDLYSLKSRVRFTKVASERFEIPASRIEEDLLDIITHLEAQKERLLSAVSPDKPIYSISPQDKEKALGYLKDPNLIENIIKDITTCGYIGEDSNKLIAYLVATSRKLKKPLSCIIVSQSATGKSYLMEKIASFIPDEEVEFYSRITPQSLYYMERDQLKHKLLIIDERSGSEEADYAIRSLQTRHKLTMAYPLKDITEGRFKTIVITMEGPISYMESSTRPKLNIENTTRSFVLYLDESESQTKQIQAHQRYIRTLEGKKRLKEIPPVINLHKDLQRLLRPIDVVIAFENLTFPSAWIRTRRDQERFLSLIEVITYLHQYQRPIETDPAANTEYIKATPQDYRIAYELSKTALLDSLNDLPKPTRAFYDLLDETASKRAIDSNREPHSFTFRRRDIREWLKLPDHVVKRHMKLLEELEYVTVKRDSKNGYITYSLLPEKTKVSYLELLTAPDELN